jgi:hypothetical protein
MKPLIIRSIFALGTLTGMVYGQEPQPQATLRVNDNCTIAARCYVVEIYFPEKLESNDLARLTAKAKCKDNAGNEAECERPKIAVLFNGKTLPQFNVELSKKDVLLKPERQGRLFAIYLPSDAVSKPLQLIFEPFKTADRELRFPSIPVGSDFTVNFEFDSYSKNFRQKIGMNANPIACEDEAAANKAALEAIEKATLAPADTALAEVADEAKMVAKYTTNCHIDAASLRTPRRPEWASLTYDHYLRDRLVRLKNWLSGLGKDKIELRVEDLTRCGTKDGKGCVPYKDWVDFRKALGFPDISGLTPEERTVRKYQFLTLKGVVVSPPSASPTESDVIRIEKVLRAYEAEQREKFLAGRILGMDDLQPFNIDTTSVYPEEDEELVNARRLYVYYDTSRDLPSKFSAQMKYINLSVADIPFEIAKPFKITSQEIAEVVINVKEDTGKVGERDRANRLDVGFQFGSSVGEKEEVTNGVTVKNIERTTRGTLDLRISPFEEVEKGEWFAWEPFFLDAKVSNDKIDKDTLSLNRVVMGMAFDFTKFLPSDSGKNPNYLNLRIKPVQASDRDFKQLEYKAIAEFQPRLAFLNRIPSAFQSTVNRVITKPGDGELTRSFPARFGFSINPVFGGEIGKTWFRRRPAAAIESTNYIKRIYTGLDITLYFPANISLSLSDKFYWNFGKDINGKPVDGRENYFKGSLDIGIRKKQGLGDSIYISFEKGNEPPFGARDLNAFKIGYRFVNPKYLGFW